MTVSYVIVEALGQGSACDRAARYVSNLLRYSLITGAILYVLLYLTIALLRIQYPFELEWMEGGDVDHVRRILSGQLLYVSPSIDFVPYIYTPLYFYLSALASAVFGIGFFSLRLVSFLSSIACLLIIGFMVKRQTGSSFSAILASGLFAATFNAGGAWFDLARVDSTFLAFFLGGMYLLTCRATRRSFVLAGSAIALSFLTKQIALPMALPVIIYCILFRRRYAAYLVVSLLVIVGASTLVLNYVHDGWYLFYVFDLPSQHPIVNGMIHSFWRVDLFSVLPAAFLFAIFYSCDQIWHSTKRDGLFYLSMTIGMVLGSWSSRIHDGGWLNVVIPAYAAICILFGLALSRVLELMRAAPQPLRNAIQICVFTNCILQFVSLVYNPVKLVPTSDDLAAGREFIGVIAKFKGEVFVPDHGYLPSMAGKKSMAQGMAISDVLRGGDSQAKLILTSSIEEAVRSRRFSAIIVDNLRAFPLGPLSSPYAEERSPLFSDSTAFFPVTSLRTRPESVYTLESTH